jgi:hypothetical protein
MDIKTACIIVWLITICAPYIHSQRVEKPNYALKSHETLEISRIEITADESLVYLTIENRMEGGTFCADRNILLIDSDGERLK